MNDPDRTLELYMGKLPRVILQRQQKTTAGRYAYEAYQDAMELQGITIEEGWEGLTDQERLAWEVAAEAVAYEVE